MSSASIVLVLAGIALVGGIALLIRGLRGKVVGDHPHCRKCGFDLYGLPKDAAVCSECGAEVNASGAVRMGQRQRRGGLAALGAAMILVALVLGAVRVIPSTQAWDLNPYKPLWWLTSDAFSNDLTTRDAAVGELQARARAGKLSAGQINGLAERVLAAQADRGRTWDPWWGDLIEQFLAAGKLSAPQQQRYFMGAVEGSVGLRVRPRVRLGDPIPFWIDHGPARLGLSGQLWAKYESPLCRMGRLVHQFPGGGGTSLSGFTSASGLAIAAKDYAGKLDVGPQELRVSSRWDISQGPSSATLAHFDWELSVPVEILPADQPTVRLKADPGARQGMEKAITANVTLHEHSKHLMVGVDVNSLLIGVGFEVFVRDGQRQWALGSLGCPAGTRHSWGLGLAVEPPVSPTVEVILKPSIAAAATTVDTSEIWDGEIVIQAVPVQRQ